MRVLVVEPLAAEGLELLRRHHDVDERLNLSREEIAAILPEYDALVVRSQVKVDAEMIAAGTRLVVVGRAGVGVDNVDLEAATRAGITVVNAPTGNTIAAAELTLALLFGLARRTAAADASMRRGEWRRSQFTGIEVRGKTLGIVGLGKIGQAIAVRARALQMAVLGSDPFVTPEQAANLGVELVAFDDLVVRSDVITVHVPKTRATTGLINAAVIGADEARRAAAQRRPRRHHRRGRPGGRAALRPGRRRRHRRLHRGAADGQPAARGAQHAADPPPRRVHRGGPGGGGRGGRRADPRRARRTPGAATRSTRRCSRPRRPRRSPRTCPLAETLGLFAAQLLRGAPRTLTIEIAGEPAAYDASSLVAAVLRGLIEATTEERVNLVNAGTLARARGITVVERKTPDAGAFASLLTLTAEAEGRAITVAGTVAGGEPRLVRLDEHAMDLAPADSMLITHHRDRPGTVGRVGVMLGEADVNISSMTLARSAPRADAFMVLALDDEPPASVIEAIRADDAVIDVWSVHLGGHR